MKLDFVDVVISRHVWLLPKSMLGFLKFYRDLVKWWFAWLLTFHPENRVDQLFSKRA